MPKKFTQGQPKIGGRKKGTPNKITGELRKVLSEVVQKYYEGTFEKDLRRLTPTSRTYLMKDLAEYVLPKLARVEKFDGDGKGNPVERKKIQFSDGTIIEL